MLLVIDIGNTNVVAAFMISPKDIVYTGRFKTNKAGTPDWAGRELRAFLDKNNVAAEEISGVIISSVVPEITDAVCAASHEISGIKPLIVGHGIKTGISIETEAPEKTGADLIAAAAGAAREYDGAIAVFDLGTATTLTVITSDRRFLGGLIMPGVKISMEAMVSRASQLPEFDIDHHGRFIGKNTVESMQSGIVYGNAAMMDALSERVEEELEESVTVIVTGGLGGIIYPNCKRKMIYEPDLVLKGLWYIYEMNK